MWIFDFEFSLKKEREFIIPLQAAKLLTNELSYVIHSALELLQTVTE